MCHVLIIEDEPLTAMNIEALLLDEGATSFDFAVSEDEAVACAIAHPPGLITSDVKLSPGHGPDAVSRIEAAVGPTPVIYVTGLPQACNGRCPPGIMLTKPLLSSAMSRAFRRLRAGSQSAQ